MSQPAVSRQRRSGTISRVVLTLVALYLSAFGATFNGVLLAPLKFATLGLIALLLLLWGVIRWRGRWQWHPTPLDPAFVLWGLAIGLSLLTNLDAARRILMGAWYIGLYMLVWYALADWLSNGGFRRETLIDALLMASLLVIAFGYVQIANSDFDLARLELPRPGSLVGNPNALGAFLVVLGLLALGRRLSTRHTIGRAAVSVYLMLLLPLLVATFSRGAWIGFGSGVTALIALAPSKGGWSLKQSWQRLTSGARRGMILSAITMTIVLVMLAGLVLRSLDAEGRSVGLRTTIYSSALQIFAERPLTGHGLFTFGEQFGQTQSQPPRQPHSHAHNGVLHVAAELGLPGLAALALSVSLVLLALRRQMQAPTHHLTRAAGAAAVGYGVHHLFDFPSMMPLIALLGLVVIALATLPQDPVPMAAVWRRRGHPLGLTGLAAGLMLTGVWSATVYSSYDAALNAPFGPNGDADYRAAADAMQSAVDADRGLVVYSSQQGYLYGLAAFHQRDMTALERGIAAYERAIDLAPYDAVIRANLAALYWQADRSQEAIATMTQAITLAPASPQLIFSLARWLDLIDDPQSVNWYRRAMTPATQLWPAWRDTTLSRQVADETDPFTPDAAVIAAIMDEQPLTEPIAGIDRDAAPVKWQVLDALMPGIAPAEAAAALANAASRAANPEQTAWVRTGFAVMALRVGDYRAAQLHIDEAVQQIAPDYATADEVFGINVPYFQYLRIAIPRRFLPQIAYPTADDALLHLIDAVQGQITP